MDDKRLKALEHAEECWHYTQHANRKEKFEYVAELMATNVFTINQIAKICRLSSQAIYGRYRPNGIKGGRFEPEALSTLSLIRRHVILDEPIPGNLLRMAVSAGCSVSCIATLVDANFSTLYYRAKGYPSGQQH